MKSQARFLALLALVALANQAKAQTVYTNFPYRNNTGFALVGVGNGATNNYAAKFNTGSFSGFLSSLNVAFANVQTFDQTATAYLLADNGLGTSPSTVLGTISTITVPFTGSTFNVIPLPFTFTATTSIPLAANTNYWVGFAKAGPATDVFLHLGVTQDTSVITNSNAFSTGTMSGPWTVFNNGNKTAFQVIGSASSPSTSAPEPATLAMLSLGIVAGTIARRRGR
jgi:hypothetical protein